MIPAAQSREPREQRCCGTDGQLVAEAIQYSLQIISPNQWDQVATDRPIMLQRRVSRVRVRITVSVTLGLGLVVLARICG